MHKLLRRQLMKSLGSVDTVAETIRPLLEAVDEAYQQSDVDRQLLERSLDLASGELLEANRELRRYADELERLVEERTALLRRSNVSLRREIAERRAAEEGIRRSEERYRALFETSKDAIFISSPDGHLVDINPAGVELFGFDSVEELLEVDVGRDLYLRPEDRQAYLSAVAERGFVRDAELELVRRNGEVITVLATTSAVRDESGRVVALRGILRDVTGQRRLEQELRQAQKMEAVGRLAGGVAHDFNNLLTAILGYCERLLTRPGADETVRSCARAIIVAAERGAGLTGQLLAFGRRQVLQPTFLDVNVVVADMHRLLRRLLPEDVEIVTDLEGELDPVRADRSQLEQVILNLAINAGDAMPGGGRLTVTTRRMAGAPGRSGGGVETGGAPCVRLSVEDTGTGIDESIRDKIFEPFFTTKDPARGTGLGLATVYSAVRQSGGRVEVASEVGVGSRFDVTLPAVAGATPHLEPPAGIPVAANGSELILLVEDDPAVQELLRDYLEGLGYATLVADDGVAGLERVRQGERRVDLVVSDLVMPRMNGVELARQLRSEQPGLKVLLISGHAHDQERLEKEALLGDDCVFLQKPFTPETLGRAIRSLLG